MAKNRRTATVALPTKVFIVAHAPLASALLEVARHAFPDAGGSLAALDIPPDVDPAEAEINLREQLEQVCANSILILADVFGATPYSIAERACSSLQNCVVICGVNVPMLWRVLAYLDSPIDRLQQKAIQGARRGAMLAPRTKPDEGK